jgi:predicted GH43/DUF377 family glycosyl hydrolase
MENHEIPRSSRKQWAVRLGAAVVLAMLFLMVLLGGFQGTSPEPVWAAHYLGGQNHATNSTAPGSVRALSVTGWDTVKVIDPVVISDGGLYKMWYSGISMDGRWRVGYATSTDGINWTKYAGNPVLDAGASGDWDSDMVRVSTVIKDGTTYHMWYLSSGHQRIGYATSPDGINWTKYAGNPVLDPGTSPSWDEGFVNFAGVISDSGVYKMWYTGGSDLTGTARIGYATSPDGINWTKYAGNPVVDAGPSAWDSVWAFAPVVIFDGSTCRMWYSGADTFPMWEGNLRIGLATSSDGTAWTKSSSNPVLDLDPTGWDSGSVTGPWVIFDGDTYHMWYHGGVPGGGNVEVIGYATSTDGTSWTKYAGNPVLRTSRLIYLPIIMKSFGL